MNPHAISDIQAPSSGGYIAAEDRDNPPDTPRHRAQVMQQLLLKGGFCPTCGRELLVSDDVRSCPRGHGTWTRARRWSYIFVITSRLLKALSHQGSPVTLPEHAGKASLG